jgi:signal transduction histidine kinase
MAREKSPAGRRSAVVRRLSPPAEERRGTRAVRADALKEEPFRDETSRLLLAQDEERRRIARELHDGTAPDLVALSLDLTRLVAMLPEGGEARRIAEGCAALCEQSLRELRTVTFALHPPVLEREGLVEALRWFAHGFGRRTGIAVGVEASAAGVGRLPPEAELALYRVAQEALTNVHRHSTSPSARITLVASGGQVRLTVADDGTAPADWLTEGRGVGIPSMRERLRALRGRLELDTGPGGTTVSAVIPRDVRKPR